MSHIGNNFYKTLFEDILTDISKAYNNLHSELLFEPNEMSKEIIDEFSDSLIKIVNNYINIQKDMLPKLKNCF